MGIQAPTSQGTFVALQTALFSYNRPVILVLIFLGGFFSALILSKKNIILSITVSLIVVFIVALYFIVSYTSTIRY